MPSAWLVAFAPALHYPDNGDGTYSNPVVSNAHWSDPSIVRVGNEYFVVCSSIETTPQHQILRSTDLVNWDVAGSMFRYWPSVDPSTNDTLNKRQAWSPRLMHLNGRFRVMWHADAHFMVAEAAAPAGPWKLLRHNLSYMNQPEPRAASAAPGPQWAATTFVDDGRTFIFACNWIQETDAAALNWIGERHYVANMLAAGVGLLENPSLHRRGGWYYWHESVNGTVTWGLSDDPNGGRGSSNKGALAVWRSRSVTGPYEGPRLLLTSNVDFTCVNTGTVVLGPDNATWFYVYDAIEARRWSMQRQMMLDRIEWDDGSGWPLPMTPSRTRRFPAGVRSSGVRWRPAPSDEFDGPGLEGVTSGVLGRKWLFKQENESLWSLQRTPGRLSLNASCVGIESDTPENLLLQRPTASYFSLETRLHWLGGCTRTSGPGRAGLIARELNSGSGVAAALVCDPSAGALRLAAFQDTLNTVWVSPFALNSTAVHLRLDVDLLKAQAWWSPTGEPGSWSSMEGTGRSEGRNPTGHTESAFIYTTTRIGWELVHAGPGAQQSPSRGLPVSGTDTLEGGGITTANQWREVDQFTTLHPGIFAGGALDAANVAEFEYFRYTDNERVATVERCESADLQ